MAEFDLISGEAAFAATPLRSNIDAAKADRAAGTASARVAGSKEQIVLLFHGIGEAPRTVSVEERPYWIGKSFFLEIVDLLRTRSFEREVILTFDDGNASDLFAASELARAGFQGYFFLLAGRLDWPCFIDAAAAREISRAGMEVGLHGHAHVDWRSNSEPDWQREVVDARAKIADAICAPVDSVAIPFGSYDRDVLKRLQHYRFRRIFTSDPGPTPAGSRIFRRTTVKRDHSIRDLVDIIENRCGILQRTRRTIAPVIKSWR